MAKRQFSTHTSDPAKIDALHDLVPEWMQSSLDEWIEGQLISSNHGVDMELLHGLERLLRTNLINGEDDYRAIRECFNKMNQDPNLKLDVVGGILKIAGTQYSGVDMLEEILVQSGSRWRVANDETGDYCLEERVDDTVTKAMEDLLDEGGDSARYIAKAWNEAFGRTPNPSAAYSNAIKAIEAASWRVVIPNNSKATLGTILAALRDKPENFKVEIAENTTEIGVETIHKQMALIWGGQTDRHGTANPVEPSQEAAEQALFISLSLCQQFIRGLVSRS